ncbi:type II toxin-antitoxin system HicB family antitoxin [Ignavigranum ruoffiae]|uniref:Predicted nuclease of the RNAse H fold, HicB family n=1 Tax=Ignavigranum ruoffiae TaxID=89093 RepID=A0A1H9ENW3_9LACT|nr:type II toxin-antitoxin system HicB family antitoxin [Ignavigranum ruoffiae]SEQ27267.1 Predicted nuclease of the RNAse H fold, HicB family [Ignavigranum ruoffiae]
MYLYYAVFTKENNQYNVHFPDLAGAYTFGNDMTDALAMAKDLLEGWLLVAENEHDKIPQASEPESLKIEPDELLIPIQVDLKLAREKHEAKLIKKTLTIPKYLNDIAVSYNINFSQTLTEALKEKLGV